MISPPAWENDLERRVAERYRDEGYDVLVHPTVSDVPPDLEGYTPNLIATRGDQKLLIAVRGSVMRSSVDRLVEAADRVRATQWKLILVTGDDVPGELMPGAEVAVPAWEEIHEQIGRLEDAGEGPGSFLVAWGVMEAVLRRHAVDSALPIHRLPTSGLIQLLYTHGELPLEGYPPLMRLLEDRDRLAYGFSFHAPSGATACLRDMISEFLKYWREEA